MTRYLYQLSLLSLVAVFVGCGPSTAGQMRTQKVTGKVTMGGAPVAGATVTFSPLDNGNPAAMGVSDAQGMYTLTTYTAGDGAVAGEYKVMVSKSAPSSTGPGEVAHDPTGAGGGPSAPSHSGPQGGGGASGSGSILPEKYAMLDTTPLMQTVTEGENNINLELN